ncbi:DUF6265 family protein [Aequorivita sediminis]|uniref:DUF6265 family protein n=1 Tax=Aequorivita sediminis TaxID=3073653 RepID=UPI0028A7873F|nr:DUF6265 family protein [Aequorivita sp. F6058]
MKKFLIYIFLPFLFVSCKNNTQEEQKEKEVVLKNYDKINQLNWLIGTWTNEIAGEYSQETWSKENDSTFTGFSFVEVNGKPERTLTMALEEKENNLFLSFLKVDEKNSKPHTFTLVSSEEGKFVFDDHNIDFPEKITYTHPAKDSLHRWIEVEIEGEPTKTNFYFTRK